MSRQLFFVLLLATGFALAQEGAGAQRAPGAAEARAKTKTPQEEARQAEDKANGAPARAEGAQARTEAAQEQAEHAQEKAEDGQPMTEGDAKLSSVQGAKALGMSILGNQDAPKALIIVPWKSSEVGESLGIVPMLDDSKQPVDKEVFMRSLRYYEIRSTTKP
jgi:hypothetical protein